MLKKKKNYTRIINVYRRQRKHKLLKITSNIIFFCFESKLNCFFKVAFTEPHRGYHVRLKRVTYNFVNFINNFTYSILFIDTLWLWRLLRIMFVYSFCQRLKYSYFQTAHLTLKLFYLGSPSSSRLGSPF